MDVIVTRRIYTRVAQIKIRYFTILIKVGNLSRGHCFEALENQEANMSNKFSSKNDINGELGCYNFFDTVYDFPEHGVNGLRAWVQLHEIKNK